MSITEILLAVCVLILVWRVWRLEDKVRFYSDHYRKRCDMNAEASRNNPSRLHMDLRFEDHRRVMDRLSRSLTSLAHALGYEWKRTEAKEGWERKPAAYEDMRVSPSWGCVSPFSSVSRACSEKVDADVMALLKRRKTDHEPTADRRNGERRKPAPKKKPRRVTR